MAGCRKAAANQMMTRGTEVLTKTVLLICVLLVAQAAFAGWPVGDPYGPDDPGDADGPDSDWDLSGLLLGFGILLAFAVLSTVLVALYDRWYRKHYGKPE